MSHLTRYVLLAIGMIAIVIVALWRLPGRLIAPNQLDYFRAFDDPVGGDIIITAAFDAGSFAVIDSCTHQWQGNDLDIEMRRKLLVARDGRSIRIGNFRVPRPPTAPPAGTSGIRVQLRSGIEVREVALELLPVNFVPLTPLIDSTSRE